MDDWRDFKDGCIHSSTFTSKCSESVFVELDLLRARPDRVWINNGDVGFWQHVEYENILTTAKTAIKLYM